MFNSKYTKLFKEENFITKYYSNFTDEEWRKFLDSYENIFREIPKNIFEWYFKQENYFTVLENNDRFVGIYGLLRINIKYNLKNINSFLCHNVGIKSEYSGQGLFQFIAEKALLNYCKDDNLVLGFPNKASYKGHIRVGWETIANIKFFQFNSLNQTTFLSDKYEFVKIDKFDKNLDAVIDKFNDNFSISLLKNSEFLNWRLSKPNSKYICFLIKNEIEIEGYLILKEYVENEEKRLHLVDFNFLDTDILEEIIKFTVKYFQNGDYIFLNTWLVENSIYEDVFLKNNFNHQAEFPSYPIILFQKSNNFEFDKIDKKKIFFTLFDNDVF